MPHAYPVSQGIGIGIGIGIGVSVGQKKAVERGDLAHARSRRRGETL